VSGLDRLEVGGGLETGKKVGKRRETPHLKGEVNQPKHPIEEKKEVKRENRTDAMI